jgi:hypothetical protein
MQSPRISFPKLAAGIGLGGLLAATATYQLQAQQAAELPPPWKQGQSASIADSKLAPVLPPPLPTAADKLPLDKLRSIEPFITGFLQNNNYVARPVDLLPMKDGSLLVSDDFNGAVYRVTRSGRVAQQ